MAEPVAVSEMVELVEERETAPVEPVADKVRGPVDVEIVLLVEPVSVTVAEVVVPEVPRVVDAVAPVPSMAAPDAVRAPFMVAPIEEERAIRLVAPETPMFVPDVPIRTPLMSTYMAAPDAESEMVELVAVRARPEAPTVNGNPAADTVRGPAEEIVLLDEPISAKVAGLVVPEAPRVVDAAAPVPRMTSPVAAKAPFTVVGAVRVRLEVSMVMGPPVADKARGPVDVDIVLLAEPVSTNVAEVVVPGAPKVVDEVAPVPSMTAPAAVRAPFTVVPVEEERAIRLVAPETPMFVPVALN